jgi:hypothetical protein
MRTARTPSPPEALVQKTSNRIVQIQVLTLVWMSAEAAVSLGAAWVARSPALLGFGGDSAIELLSAAVVLRHFYLTSSRAHAEERTTKIAVCFSSSQHLLSLRQLLRS